MMFGLLRRQHALHTKKMTEVMALVQQLVDENQRLRALHLKAITTLFAKDCLIDGLKKQAADCRDQVKP